jgi:hypothetical protein
LANRLKNFFSRGLNIKARSYGILRRSMVSCCLQVRSQQRDQQRQIRNKHSREQSNYVEVVSVSVPVPSGPQISKRLLPTLPSDREGHRHANSRLALMC